MKACPKTQFCGKRRIDIAVAATVGNFNTGAGNEAILLQSFRISDSINTRNAVKLKDQKRLHFAAKKASENYKMGRLALRAFTKAKADKTFYSSVSFGLS